MTEQKGKIMHKAPGPAGIFTCENGHFELEGPCLIRGRYNVIEILDSNGQSAVLVLAEDVSNAKQLVVIKVMHSHLYDIGVQESHMLMELAALDPNNLAHTVRLITTVVYGSHYCLVMEPLLPDPLTTVFASLPKEKRLANIRKVGLRLLACIGFLHGHNIIHTDLKPENMLLKDENDLDSVHVVDFGSAVHDVEREVALYYKDFQLQTPLYRAPEVVFGVSLGKEMDMWSLGCVLAELYLGERLFLGDTIEEILSKMVDILGHLPSRTFRKGKFFRKYQEYTYDSAPINDTLKLLEVLQCEDILFADLLTGLLKYEPGERLAVSQAACHPFFASYFPIAFLMPDNKGKMAVTQGGLCPDSPIASPRSVKAGQTHTDTPTESHRAHKATPTGHRRTHGAKSTKSNRSTKVIEIHKTDKVTPTQSHESHLTTSESHKMHRDSSRESAGTYKTMLPAVGRTHQNMATESGRASKPKLSGMNETFDVKQEMNDDTFVLKPGRKFSSPKQSSLSQESVSLKDIKPVDVEKRSVESNAVHRSHRKIVVVMPNSTYNASVNEPQNKPKRTVSGLTPSKRTHIIIDTHSNAKRKLVNISNEDEHKISADYKCNSKDLETNQCEPLTSEHRKVSKESNAKGSQKYHQYNKDEDVNRKKSSPFVEHQGLPKSYLYNENKAGNQEMKQRFSQIVVHKGVHMSDRRVLNYEKDGDTEKYSDTDSHSSGVEVRQRSRGHLTKMDQHDASTKVLQKPEAHRREKRSSDQFRGTNRLEANLQQVTKKRTSDQMPESNRTGQVYQGTDRIFQIGILGSGSTVERQQQRTNRVSSNLQKGTSDRSPNHQGSSKILNDDLQQGSSRHYDPQRTSSITSCHQKVMHMRSPGHVHETNRRSADDMQGTVDNYSPSQQRIKRRSNCESEAVENVRKKCRNDYHGELDDPQHYRLNEQSVGNSVESVVSLDGINSDESLKGDSEDDFLDNERENSCSDDDVREEQDDITVDKVSDLSDEGNRKNFTGQRQVNEMAGIGNRATKPAWLHDDSLDEINGISSDEDLDYDHNAYSRSTGKDNDIDRHQVVTAPFTDEGKDVNLRKAVRVRSTGKSKAGTPHKAVYRKSESSRQHGTSTEDFDGSYSNTEDGMDQQEERVKRSRDKLKAAQKGSTVADIGGSYRNPDEGEDIDQSEKRSKKSRDQRKAVFISNPVGDRNLLEKQVAIDYRTANDQRNDSLEELVHKKVEERSRKEMSPQNMKKLKQQILQKRLDVDSQRHVEMDTLQSIAVGRNQQPSRQTSQLMRQRLASPEHVRSPAGTSDKGKTKNNSKKNNPNKSYDNAELPTGVQDSGKRVLTHETMLTSRRPSANRHSDPLMIKTEPLSSSSLVTDPSSDNLSGDDEYVDLLSPVVHNNKPGKTSQLAEKKGSRRSLKRSLEESSDILQVSKVRGPNYRAIDKDRNKCSQTNSRSYR